MFVVYGEVGIITTDSKTHQKSVSFSETRQTAKAFFLAVSLVPQNQTEKAFSIHFIKVAAKWPCQAFTAASTKKALNWLHLDCVLPRPSLRYEKAILRFKLKNLGACASTR